MHWVIFIAMPRFLLVMPHGSRIYNNLPFLFGIILANPTDWLMIDSKPTGSGARCALAPMMVWLVFYVPVASILFLVSDLGRSTSMLLGSMCGGIQDLRDIFSLVLIVEPSRLSSFYTCLEDGARAVTWAASLSL
ncbi:hypothetical protein YC2023_004737 [Brassica napus]